MNHFTIYVTGPEDCDKEALTDELEGALLERGVAVIRSGAGDVGMDSRAVSAARGSVAALVTAESLPEVEPPGAGHLPPRFLEVRLLPDRGESQPESPQDQPFLIRASADRKSAGQSVDFILGTLERIGVIPTNPAADYTEEDEQKIAERLEDLGYM